MLPAGQTIYPLTFTVPNNIPSSFEGKLGSIRYELEGLNFHRLLFLGLAFFVTAEGVAQIALYTVLQGNFGQKT